MTRCWCWRAPYRVVDVLRATVRPSSRDHAMLDITDPDAVDGVLLGAAPDVVVNCAAYTAVDAAETDEAAATPINGDRRPATSRSGAPANGARLIHVSTDYVFSGDADDAVRRRRRRLDPRSAYGRSKAGRRARRRSPPAATPTSSGPRGSTASPGRNFVKTIARLAGERETLDVVDDQRGSPTWSLHLARGLTALGVADVAPGIWHCTGAGETTWYGFARAIFAELGLDPARVRPTTTEAFPRPAPRPSYSVLSDAASGIEAGLPELPHWRDALHEAFLAVGEDLVGR